MTLRSLELLESDPATEIIVLISKPPDPYTLEKIDKLCSQMQTPVVACFQGFRCNQGHFIQCNSLDEAARQTFCHLNNQPMQAVPFTSLSYVLQKLRDIGSRQEGREVLGLYTGGTLAKELQLQLSQTLGTTRHTVLDLGDDQYTLGRPHPMIAPESRIETLDQYGIIGDLENCGVLLVDIVLGYGSHNDPATVLVEGVSAISKKYKCSFEVVVALIATDNDIQDTDGQRAILEAAGMHVFRINTEAARFAELLVKPANITHYLKTE